jgi:hypothetical protein
MSPFGVLRALIAYQYWYGFNRASSAAAPGLRLCLCGNVIHENREPQSDLPPLVTVLQS